MAEKKGFDLAALLGSVPDLSSGTEQIELIPWEKLIPDDRNFYSLDGLPELADSIATVGLMDPIRVRKDGDVYVIISGHRRRAAIKLLIDSGEERWKTGVPCIVERGEISSELAELKLIFANSATRQLSAAELSRQAARVEELLYALKEQGYSFPGRMQAHVAQACGTTESKLKRLHAIRANLDPQLLTMFDAGKLNEEAAYRLQQLPEDVQDYLGKQKAIQNNGVMGDRAREMSEHANRMLHPKCKCPDGSKCEHTLPRFKQTARASMCWATCSGGCCLECNLSLSECPYRCKRSLDKIETEKAEKKEAEKAAEEKEERQREIQRKRLSKEYGALLTLAEAAGLEDDTPLYFEDSWCVKDLRARASGEGFSRWKLTKHNHPISGSFSVRSAAEIAAMLNVPVTDLIRIGSGGSINLPEEEPETEAAEPAPAGAPEPAWQTGTPERKGRYFASILIRDTRRGDSVSEHRAEWDGESWWLYQQQLLPGYEVVGWWPLPENVSEEAIEG